MAWRCTGKTNAELVENLYRAGLISSPVVRAAFLGVDRAHYAPSLPYEDCPQSIGHGATISAPHMHAQAVESLLPYTARPRRVLDIGSGSGYLTHVLAELVGETGVVVGLEHIRELQQMGERNMGNSNQEGKEEEQQQEEEEKKGEVNGVEEGDEGGWDAIHVGAAAVKLHQELVDQLRRPGRMFIPVGSKNDGGGQFIWTVDKDEAGNVTKTRGYGVRYVPLTDAPRR
ncbi:protein-L-isoaspartate O-methyltransferase [Xylariales sp. PMI_506]|nr:protein-L-isoaspartate O-methyltransferase [Xylariales sp. PMI_506]